MDILNGFIETAVNVGRVFLVLLALVLFLAFAAYVLYRFFHSNISAIEMLGGCIMFWVIVMPTATIGAFCVNQMAATLSVSLLIERGLAWGGLMLGAMAGIYLWRWIGTR